MKNKLLSGASPALVCLVIALAAWTNPAAAANANLTGSATVVPSCVLSTTQNINFGVYDPLGAHAVSKPAAQGQITMRCSRGSYSVSLSNGSYSSRFIASQRDAGYPASQFGYYYTYGCGRRMAGPGGTYVSYNLGTSAAGNSYNLTGPEVWSGGTQPSCSSGGPTRSFRSVSFTTLGDVDIPIYAQVVDVESSRARPGAYSDSVVVSVVF